VLPIDRGSGGKVLLAFAGDGAAARFPAVDAGELETIRRRGWAASVAEREDGVCSVSAPVLDPGGRVLAAVGVSGPINRLGRQPGRQLAAPVVAAARELERRAGLMAGG
jgi:DNA-binding IclR family transcriptional regulator